MKGDKSLKLDGVYEWLINHTTRGDSIPTHVDLAVMGGAEKLCGQYWEGTVEHQHMLVDPFIDPSLAFTSLQTPVSFPDIVTSLAKDLFTRLPVEIIQYISLLILHDRELASTPACLAPSSSQSFTQKLTSSDSKPDKYVVNPYHTIHFFRHASPTVFRASSNFGTTFWYTVIRNEVFPFASATLVAEIKKVRSLALTQGTNTLLSGKERASGSKNRKGKAKRQHEVGDGLNMHWIWLTLRCHKGLRNRRRIIRFIAGIFGMGDSIVEVERGREKNGDKEEF
ncbi:hypothetical protein BDP27DRAFT_1223658 [Rhodocollybia butyracea]|uniref:Uncharacterized protein n=1 Tax=Rhodocollybia butyracea TaxID=206335 RepID=A0A9P5PSV4_9AGAR|nr:hypothetical protein BDP27DRAFT_1223658 [Rhodocollybia butyracea]